MPDSPPITTAPASAGGLRDDVHADPDTHSGSLFVKRLLAECFGTFMLVMVDCGGAVIGSLDAEITAVARSTATGLLIMVMIIRSVTSPAHTSTPPSRPRSRCEAPSPGDGSQCTGSPRSLVRSSGPGSFDRMFGNVEHLGATLPHFGAARGFGMEVVLTAILVSVVLGTATRHRSIGANAAIASGGAVALCSLFSRPVSGASMNPARSLAPAVVSGELHDLWIYLLAPFVGAAVATLTMRVLHSHKHKSEREAAQGR